MSNTKSADRLKRFLKAIHSYNPKYTATYLCKEQGINHSALSEIINKGKNETRIDEYFNEFKKLLLDGFGIRTIESGEGEFEFSENKAEISPQLDYEQFVREVEALPEKGEVRILSSWLLSLYPTNEGEGYIIRLLKASTKVKILLGKPEGYFIEDRIRVLSALGDQPQQAHAIDEVYKSANKLLKLQEEYKGGLEFKLYDTFPGLRLFIHDKKIYTNLLLSNKSADTIFTTVYDNNGSESARTLNGHFENLWEAATEYIRPNTPLTLAEIGDFTGIYKVYTYGHNKEREPCSVIGAMEIFGDGRVTHRSYKYNSPDQFQVNYGLARRLGQVIYVEVCNELKPDRKGLFILNTKGFEPLSNNRNIIAGVIAGLTREDYKPMALRVILEKMPNDTRLEDFKPAKIRLADHVPDGHVIPAEIKRILSGYFRNTISFSHATSISSLDSLELEIKGEKTVLGEMFYGYALYLFANNGETKKIIDVLRWAFTHGFDNCDMAKKDFDTKINFDEEPGLAIFRRIKAEKDKKSK